MVSRPGTVAAENDSSAAPSPGARTRVEYEWTYSGLATGDPVTYEACVNVAGDAARDNDCDSVSATAE
jgi:hypothetical protein